MSDGSLNNNGNVKVENGQVVVTAPDAGGTLAAVCPGKNVEIYVDDKLISEKTPVTAANCIRLAPALIPGKNEFKLRFDRNRTHAYISILSQSGKRAVVEDCPPVQELVLDSSRWEDALPDDPAAEEVLEFLGERGVRYGINGEWIAQALACKNGEETLVAEGVEPKSGKDAYIEACFEKDRKTKAGSDEMWVDHFDYGTVISVDAGSVVAKKIPTEPGKPGIDVLGNEIEPRPPRDVKLEAGKGIKINDDGLAAVALSGGHPVIRGGLVILVPTYTVEGDVDKNTGNIYFKGDVIVRGNIQDGLKVEATGSVKVHGHASQCRVQAGGNVEITRNVVGCEIRAGGKKVRFFDLKDLLEGYLKGLQELVAAARFLSKDARLEGRAKIQEYGQGAIVKVLLDTKFNHLSEQQANLMRAVESVGEELAVLEVYEEFLQYALILKQKLAGLGPLELESVDALELLCGHFRNAAVKILEMVEGLVGEKARVMVGYVQHSTLESSGDIIITGKGAYNIKISAGGSVLVRDQRGFIRGGEISAQGDVEVYELGSAGGAVTKVHVPADKEIRVVETHSGVTLRVGTTVKNKEMRIGDMG